MIIGLSCAIEAQSVPPTTGRQPPWLHLEAATLDPTRGRLVVFGGTGRSEAGQWHGGDSGDLWEWDGAEWHLIAHDTGPGPRRGHSMGYDQNRKLVILFGGARSRPSPEKGIEMLCDT